MPLQQVSTILTEILGLPGQRAPLEAHMPLLGHLPEFDSMAVVAVLTAIEDRFGISIDDDEVDATIFETVGSLDAFVSAKCADAAD